MNKNFFTELSRVLAKHSIETAPPERNALPILLNGLPACRVEPSGDMCIFPGDLRSPEANELYHKAAPFSSEVREYLTAIERAPLLKATALDGTSGCWRSLAALFLPVGRPSTDICSLPGSGTTKALAY